jgi:hypothetical protein
MTVEYASDRLTCYALMDPRNRFCRRNTYRMSSAGVSELLEEVAPVAMRGKRDCHRAYAEWTRRVACRRRTHQDMRTAVTFKREPAQSWTNEQRIRHREEIVDGRK